MTWIAITIAALVAMLLVMVEHWLPWKEILGKELSRPAAYILGTLAILLPLSGLLMIVDLDKGSLLVAIWIITMAAGAGTCLGYVIDGWLSMRSRMMVSEREAQILRPGVAGWDE